VLSADKAVDNSGGTRFGSAWTDNQWWQVDLGAPVTVGKVSIEWEAAYASSYRILTSLDGTNWTQQASVSLTNAATKVTSFDATTARYVRIQSVKRATQYGISFWGVHVYGGATPASAPKPPVQSVPTPPVVTPPRATPPRATPPTPPVKRPAGPRRKPAAVKDRAAMRTLVRRCRTVLKRRGGRTAAQRTAACNKRAKKRAAALRS
jgi:hypothetical protein